MRHPSSVERSDGRRCDRALNSTATAADLNELIGCAFSFQTVEVRQVYPVAMDVLQVVLTLESEFRYHLPALHICKEMQPVYRRCQLMGSPRNRRLKGGKNYFLMHFKLPVLLQLV